MPCTSSGKEAGIATPPTFVRLINWRKDIGNEIGKICLKMKKSAAQQKDEEQKKGDEKPLFHEENLPREAPPTFLGCKHQRAALLRQR